MKLRTQIQNNVNAPHRGVTFVDEDDKVFYVMTDVLENYEGSAQERAERIVAEYMLADIALRSNEWTSGFAEKIIRRLNELKSALMYILVTEAREQIVFAKNKGEQKNGNTNTDYTI